MFKQVHQYFTRFLSEKNFPYPEVGGELKGKSILPIGIASSYVLGNWYLKEFDRRVIALVPQIYYSRYVDDILVVLENPDFTFHDEEKCSTVRFDFERYKAEVGESADGIDHLTLTKSEKFLLERFYPIIKLISLPEKFMADPKTDKEKKERIFKITCVEGAYFQPQKTLIYDFDVEESTSVIDKLKQELEERASEFRDFPEDEFGEDNFDEEAYHLIFDGTEGKIRTLKDYKENRYGLSVFLANRIFAALKRVQPVNKEESAKLLKLFKGLNNLEYFRLWEKIFTYFLVNEDRDGFIRFYKHTCDEISKLYNYDKIQRSDLTSRDVFLGMIEYFDIAVEMTLSLNPNFLVAGTKSFKDLQFYQKLKLDEFELFDEIELIPPVVAQLKRFRRSNLIRHHYVAHPLMNFTKAGRISHLNLVDRHLPKKDEFNSQDFEISEAAKSLSPRTVKFWECCVAIMNKTMLASHKSKFLSTRGGYQFTSILGDEMGHEHLLASAYKLYKDINKAHIPYGLPSESDFFSCFSQNVDGPIDLNSVIINEIRVDSSKKFSKPIKIAIGNTDVDITTIHSSLKGKPILSHERYNVFAKMLRQCRKEKVDIFCLPEFSIAYEFVASLAKYGDKNGMAIVAGLEHWTIDKVAYNFLINIIPTTFGGGSDAIVLYRLKNHYAPIEEAIIRDYSYTVPKPRPYKYHLMHWRNLYFTSFYCFEFADVFHRSLFRSKVDLIIASEWNRDTSYFSNIVESLSRDLHCYIAQVNTSPYGDSRLTQPSETARKDILKLKGGRNNTILVGEIFIDALRDFQLRNFSGTKYDSESKFKPLPPDWDRDYVEKRINGNRIFDNAEDFDDKIK